MAACIVFILVIIVFFDNKLVLMLMWCMLCFFECAVTDTIMSVILITLIRVILCIVNVSLRFQIVVINLQITLSQKLRDCIGLWMNRAEQRGIVNITISIQPR